MNEADSRSGYTPLHLAASVDNVEVLKTLHMSKQVDFWKKAKNVGLVQKFLLKLVTQMITQIDCTTGLFGSPRCIRSRLR